MNDLVITKVVTYSDLNPENYALKNTYVSNLFTTALSTLPVIERVSQGVVSIVRGFKSKKSIVSDIPNPTSLDFKFGEGLAIEIQIDPYNHGLVLAALKKIIEDNNAPFKFVIDKAKQRVVIYRIKKNSHISEDLIDEERIVFINR